MILKTDINWPSLRLWAFLLLLCTGMSSCVTYDDFVILNEERPGLDSLLDVNELEPITIKANDRLAVQVSARYGRDLEATAPYNLNPEGPTEYRVGKNGYITFPSLGPILVADLTLEEANAKIKDELSEYLIDPVVMLELTNFKVTLLGEFNSPGNLEVDGESIDLLTAMGLAGGLTDFADRSEILVIREVNGARRFGKIDLHKTRQTLNSPYYQLRQNDVVYALPIEQRVYGIPDQGTRILQYVGLGTTLLNLVLILTRL